MKEPIVKRIGFERVELEWQRDDRFTSYSISRVSFDVNGKTGIQYTNENYKWVESKELFGVGRNYYDINTWNPQLNKNEAECQQLCINDQTCVFAIHFYQDQDRGTNDTKNRKPILPNGAKANTCILQKGLKIESGTQKDTSANIWYLIGSYYDALISH